MTHFRKLFWGLLLLDLTLCNLRCAALGYFLLALGAAGLAPVSPQLPPGGPVELGRVDLGPLSVWLRDLVVIGGPMIGDDARYTERSHADRLPLDLVVGGRNRGICRRPRPARPCPAGRAPPHRLPGSLPRTGSCLFSGGVVRNQPVPIGAIELSLGSGPCVARVAGDDPSPGCPGASRGCRPG